MRSLSQAILESKGSSSGEKRKLEDDLEDLANDIEALLKRNKLEKALDKYSPGAAIDNNLNKISDDDKAEAKKLMKEYDKLYSELNENLDEGIQLDESVQSIMADITGDLQPEQVKYLATAVMTALVVGGTITYEKIVQMLKKSGKLKDDLIKKLEDAKK